MASLIAYCDESGQRDYGPKTDRYFVVSAVVALATDAPRLEDEIRGIKRAFWHDPQVEVKSNWMRIPSARKKNYTDKHGIGPKDIEKMLEALYPWMSHAPIRLLAGVVDKKLMQDRYATPHYAGTVAYTVLLQRLQKYAAKNSATVNIVFDDPAGKSPGGLQWRDLLARLHSKLLRTGCPYTQMKFTNVGALTFTDSASSNLVQLADQVAYNVFRQFRDHGKEWENATLQHLPLYEYLRLLIDLFDTGPERQFAGYGIAKWPVETKVPWCVSG